MCNIEIKDLTETTDLDRTVMAKIQGGYFGGYSTSGGYFSTATPNDPGLVASKPIFG
jgi:hypothetical protein